MSAVSLNPENFIEGSGLIDDVDGIVKSAVFEMFDYNGKADKPAPCLKLEIDVADAVMEQYYSMGSAADWIPSEDGTQLLSVGTATSIRLSSNGGIFLMSLVESGFPADKLGEDITILDGLVAHWIQVPLPERKGVKKSKEQKEREEKYGPPTLLAVSEVITLPWEKKKAPGGKKKATTKKATKKSAAKKSAKKVEAEESSDVETKTQEAILGILSADGSIPKAKLPARIFSECADDEDKSEMVQVAFKDEFLESGPWNFEDGELSLG